MVLVFQMQVITRMVVTFNGNQNSGLEWGVLSDDLGCVTRTASLLDKVNQRWVTGGGKNRLIKVTLERVGESKFDFHLSYQLASPF